MEKQKSIKSENNINNFSKKPILQIIVNKILSCPNQTISKASGFIESLISKNIKNLKLFSEDGLPDEIPILRSIIWKINLGYLPINNEEYTSLVISANAIAMIGGNNDQIVPTNIPFILPEIYLVNILNRCTVILSIENA